MRGCGAGAGLAVPPPLLLLGLLLAAAPGAALGKETAFVEVVLFESSPSGDYTTYTTGLQGRFSRAGATLSAEGEIVQVSASRGAPPAPRWLRGPGRPAPGGTKPAPGRAAAPRAPRGLGARGAAAAVTDSRWRTKAPPRSAPAAGPRSRGLAEPGRRGAPRGCRRRRRRSPV